MEFATAVQKLASHKIKKSEKSKGVLEKGVPLLDSNVFTKQGDEGEPIHLGTA